MKTRFNLLKILFGHHFGYFFLPIILVLFIFSPEAFSFPVSDGFDFPVGKPNGDGYHIGGGFDFLDQNKDDGSYHPGEDWNRPGGKDGDNDLGDPVYAVSHGIVVASGSYKTWGNIILIKHQLPDGTTVWSQYAHLRDRLVGVGQEVEKGKQIIGTIGKGENNQFWAHLHFEIRRVDLPPNNWFPDVSNKATVEAKYFRPTDFIKDHRNLTGNQHTLTTSVNPSGSGSISPSDGTYNAGAQVTLTATPNDRFDYWSGDASGNSNPITITMDKNKSVTANFKTDGWKGEYWNNQNLTGNPVLVRYYDSVDFDWRDGSPDGSVPNDHFSARWTRQLNFTAGRYCFHLLGDDGIRLWVNDNRIIDEWKDQSGNEYTREVELADGNYNLKVEYYENGGGARVKLWWDSNCTYTLTTSVDPSGSGSVSPSGGTYNPGTQVTLEAKANSDYRFVNWSGDASGNSNPTTITMDRNKSVTANFIKIHTLTTSVNADGGSVDPSGTHTYDAGAQVTLTATPNSCYRFDHWDGAASGNSNPVTLTMDRAKSVTANFIKPTILPPEPISNPNDAGSWRNVGRMLTPKQNFAAAALNGNLYVIGGWDDAQISNTVEEYSFKTLCWRTVARMPTPRRELAAVVLNGRIYALGGWNDGKALNTVEEYNPETNTWREVKPMPTPRYVLAAAALNGRIYALGGKIDDKVLNTVEEYNPETNTWREVKPMPTGRTGLAATAVKNKLYAIGGGNPTQGTVEEYTPETNSWRIVAPITPPRWGLAAVPKSGRIYTVGGGDVVEEYTPETDTWRTVAPMPTARYGLAAVELNGVIYAIGGGDGAGGKSFDIVEEYTPLRAPDISVIAPTPNQVLPVGTSSTTLTVKIDNHTGPWHWQLNIPFPASGPAGGVRVASGNTAEIRGLQDGRTYTVYVAIADASGNILRSSVPASVTFSVDQPPVHLSVKGVENVGSSVLKIHYRVDDPKGESFVTAGWSYSRDEGVTWTSIPAAAIGDNALKPPGESFITWDTTQTPALQAASQLRVWFRMYVWNPDNDGSWRGVRPMLTARQNLAAASVNGKLYVIGGWDDNNISNTVEEYTPENDSWRMVAPMPTPRWGLAAVTFNGKLYAIGGWDGSKALDTVEEYTPETNSWRTVAPMPTARYALSAVALNGKIYAIGGWRSGPHPLSTVEEYTPETNSWRTVAPMPTARGGLAAGALNGKLYAIGGAYYVDVLNTVEEYTLETNSWRTVAPITSPRWGLAAATLNGRLYATGGGDTVDEYTPETDRWRAVAPMPTARYGLGAVSLNGKLYAMGGWDGGGGPSLNVVEEYTPPRASEPVSFVIPPPPDGTKIIVSSVNVSQGQLFTVEVKVEVVNKNLAGFQLGVLFNKDVLEATKVEEGDFLKRGGANTFWQPGKMDNAQGAISDVVATRIGGGGLDGTGTLLTITFKAKKNGKSPLTLQNVKLGDPSSQPISYQAIAGEVMVDLCQAWDVNCDGCVDIFDLIAVATDFKKKTPRADVNGDGEVNIFDLILVASHFGECSHPAAAAPQIAGGQHAAMIERWLKEARSADDGSEIFRRGIAILESLLNAIVPEKTAMFPNYPNPFNPETWIPYQLNEASEVTLTIYDAGGRVVKRLDLGYQPAGLYRMRDRAAYWDGRNEVGEPVASGVYFVQLRTKKYQQTRRMVLLK